MRSPRPPHPARAHRAVALGAAALGALALVACGGRGPTTAEPTPPAWGYTDADGPGQWGSLDPEWKQCDTGGFQSPVDLVQPAPSDQSPLVLTWSASDARLRDTGKAVQVDHEVGELTLDGKTYTLVGLHAHTPGEHALDGRVYPMELHFVHATPLGELAVVGVLVSEGAENPALAPIVDALPGLKPGGEGITLSAFDPNRLLPDQSSRIHYRGSLTTPPCSEGVAWNVMATPITASAAQIAAFSARHPANARPLQPLGERTLSIETPGWTTP